MKFAVAFGGPEVRALQLVWARRPRALAVVPPRSATAGGSQPVLGMRAQKA